MNKRDEFLNKCRHANKYKLKNSKYDQHVDLLYHTANPYIENEPAINIIVKYLSNPRRRSNQQIIHNSTGQPSSNNMHDVPIIHTVGLNFIGTVTAVIMNNGDILTSARPRMQNRRIYNTDLIT